MTKQPPKPEDEKGIDWSKKDMYEGLGRSDLKPPQPSQDWEKRFDDLYYASGRTPAQMKSFIRELLEKTREEAVKEGEKKHEDSCPTMREAEIRMKQAITAKVRERIEDYFKELIVIP